ncbi:putative glyoxalase superfamily protein PhnB [Leucobacter komagatae]|uniref:Putative glyoxalase superfamily protein PhnB n=2 Tax=Leucobacter komagatae TaxID=55969 RepID=A0A542Y311_9MICO|nr:putative glyoxalase superfamily protein PhnB [Leucobacter komagatae]
MDDGGWGYDSTMSLTLDFIGIVTTDLAASLAFYRELGLEIPADADGEAHVEAVPPGGMRIGWDTLETIQGFDPAYEVPTGSHRVAFAFQAGSPAEVDTVFAKLTAGGATARVEPWDAFWGQRYATVMDPDGNAVDIYAPLPGS